MRVDEHADMCIPLLLYLHEAAPILGAVFIKRSEYLYSSRSQMPTKFREKWGEVGIEVV